MSSSFSIDCNIDPDEMHRAIQIEIASHICRKKKMKTPDFKKMPIKQIEAFVQKNYQYL